MAQLMPLSLTVSCFSKIQIGFTFLVPAHLGSPGQRAIKCMYVYLYVPWSKCWPVRIDQLACFLPWFLSNRPVIFCWLIDKSVSGLHVRCSLVKIVKVKQDIGCIVHSAWDVLVYINSLIVLLLSVFVSLTYFSWFIRGWVNPCPKNEPSGIIGTGFLTGQMRASYWKEMLFMLDDADASTYSQSNPIQ